MNSTPLTGLPYQIALEDRFTDLLTVYEGVKVHNKGDESETHATARVGHTDIPAIIAPGDVGNARMKRQEMMSSSLTTEMEYRYVQLLGPWPLISLEDEVEGNSDGIRWTIVAVDVDQTQAFTKLLIERLQPGNI